MPIAQIVYLEVQPEKLDEFHAEAAANVRASRQEPGVIQFELLQQTDSPTKFMLYEVYNTPADLEAHRQTAHFSRWLERGLPLLVGDRVRVLYQLIEV